YFALQRGLVRSLGGVAGGDASDGVDEGLRLGGLLVGEGSTGRRERGEEGADRGGERVERGTVGRLSRGQVGHGGRERGEVFVDGGHGCLQGCGDQSLDLLGGEADVDG